MQEKSDIREYLLGSLEPEERRRELELRMLSDESWLDKISIEEEELIDDYLSADLNEMERLSFETFFIHSPGRRLKLNIATALREYHESPSKGESAAGFTSPSLVNSLRAGFQKLIPYPALLLGILVLFCSFLFWRADRNSPPGFLAWMRRENQSKGREIDIRQEIQPSIAATLSTGQDRALGGLYTIRLTSEIKTIRFQLLLANDEHDRYQAYLKNGSLIDPIGEPTESSALEDKRAVILNIPTSYIPAGDFILQLSGVARNGRMESVGGYPCRVLKK
jgi:hypothetical protein